MLTPALHLGRVLSPTGSGALTDVADGAILVGEGGRLVAVGERAAVHAAHPGVMVRDHRPGVLVPGFVDAHVHLAQVFARARAGLDLLDWLDQAIFPAELRFADVGHAERAARAFVADCARHGVTTANVFLSSHPAAAQRCFEVLAATGLRAIAGLVHMDRDAPGGLCLDAKASVAAAEDLAGRWHGHDGDRLRYAITPRFALSCSDAMLGELGKLASTDGTLHVHTHLSESPRECAAVAARFAAAADYLAVYESFGLVGPRSLFAHAIHLSDRELGALAAHGAGVAHCPSSNLFLKSGAFPWRRYEAAGVRFGLGSDVAAGPELSPLRVMRDAYMVQPSDFLAPEALLFRATLGGAQALRLDDRVGSLEVGKDADFVVLRPERRPEIALQPPSTTAELCAAITFLGDDRLVDSTWVRGRRLDPDDPDAS